MKTARGNRVRLKAQSKKKLEDTAKNLADDDLIQLILNIIEFGKALTGIELYYYQFLIVFRAIYSLLKVDGETFTVLISRQAGKTEAIVFLVPTITVLFPAMANILPEYFSQFKDGVMVGLFAPQKEQVSTSYQRIMKALNSQSAVEIMADPDIDVENTSSVNLNLSNGSFMKGQSCGKTSKIESKSFSIAFIDEAQDVDTWIIDKSIMPMLSAVGGCCVKIGTTGRTKNHFWDDIQYNSKRSTRIKDPRLKLHFEFNWKQVSKYKKEVYEKTKVRMHSFYEKSVLNEKARAERRGDTEAFELNYELKWALESGQFVTDSLFKKMANGRKGLASYLNDGDVVVAGLDIAKHPASTVLTIARVKEVDQEGESEFALPIRKKEILRWYDFGNMDYEQQHYALLDALKLFQVCILYADYTGVGRAVVDRLTHALMEVVEVVPYTFTQQSKSEMWVSLSNDMESGRIEFPANKATRSSEEFTKFEDQLKGVTKRYEGSYLILEKDRGTFDDYVDSLGLMVLAGNSIMVESSDYQVEVVDNPLYAELQNSRSIYSNLSH
ncbi:phage terminase large subunit family protein [Flammeovirga agarivorans]|uniref:Terminase large subunit gp17-like C-terminal domain-containing protein n=1 Tax=Flammeovirga agarivorans TaxID=2726742 RepID=A0A7X8XZ76_9BACT|nr:hypothetical protein [Flammeovirga agarivorans]NLR94892.1 hypothetical protein [Flammeovirga agarivorans]